MYKVAVITSLLLASTLCHANLRTQNLRSEGIFPLPVDSYKLIDDKSLTIDVLIDVAGLGTAWGTSIGLQGDLRDMGAIDLSGAPLTPPQGPFPFTRGTRFAVAGFLYPKGALSSCVQNSASSCEPTADAIGNMIAKGIDIADLNVSVPGQGTNYFSHYYLISNMKGNYKGTILIQGLSPNPISDNRTYTVAGVGATGSFINLGREVTFQNMGLVGNNAYVVIRVTLNFAGNQNNQN